MRRLVEFVRRHMLLAGFMAALVPLLVLLGLQARWLARLEHVTQIAYLAALGNCLEAIGSEVQIHYRTQAVQALDLPSSVLVKGQLDKIADYWRKTDMEGVRRLYLVDFTRDPYGNYFQFDPSQGSLRMAAASDESMAVIVASTPYQLLSSRKGTGTDIALRVDERDPENRLILNPITDESSRVVGIAAMVLDERYLRSVLLPALVARALPSFFPDADPDDFSVLVRDEGGQLIVALGDGAGEDEAVRRNLPFVFQDWSLVLKSRTSLPERWAGASFALNMTLSVLIAAVLLGGTLLALMAARRTMKLSSMKSDFVSNVSHELRTPIASIRVFAELLRLGRVSSPEKMREYGDYIEAESRRLSRLIDNILDFSRIESGRRTYTFVTAHLEDVVAATLQSFEMRTRPEGFKVVLERPPVPLPPVTIDPDAIGQALHNLLDNAVKYSDGAKEIGLCLARENDSVVISVRDQGVGIPAAEQRRIFERFHRVGSSLLHDVKGTGLGLSIVQHIVGAHGGEITVNAEPGKGSTFSIRLPVSAGSVPDETPHAGSLPQARPVNPAGENST